MYIYVKKDVLYIDQNMKQKIGKTKNIIEIKTNFKKKKVYFQLI